MKNNLTNYTFNKLVRKKWTINPVERIKKSKKKYDRKRAKRNFRKRINEEL